MYKICIKRPVTTIMVMFIAILAGVVSLMNLKLDLMPQMDIPIAVVSTTYVGAGPEEIESLITEPIEEAMGTVSNVDSITSTSSANSSMVLVQFADGTDIDMAAVDMRENLDLIRSTLPEDAGDPLVMKIDLASMSSMMIGVHGGSMDMEELTTLLEDSIVNRLERIEGVASVSLTGAVEDEVQVILNPERMEGYGLSTAQLIGTLQAENLNLPAGEIEQGTARLQLRSTGEFSSLDDIRNLPITTPTGALIHLRDVADVQIAQKEQDSYALINGEQSILLTVQKQSNANVVDVADRVTAELERIGQDYPELTLSMLTNTSEYIRSSVNNVLETAIQAAIMAVIVLFLFLRSAKSSLIIAISIPTSIIFTFALMYVSGMTLNIISLGGLTIGVGMLVDNSVVVLECIYRHHARGESPEEAAKNGTKEVSMSVAASTLTTVAVFLPLAFIEGVFGQVFQSLSFTICFALIVSLVVSLSFVPMACAKLLRDSDRDGGRGPRWLVRFLDGWRCGLDKIDSGYRRLLGGALHHKRLTVLVVLACFIGSMGLIPLTGVNLMPEMDQGSANITIEMPQGTVLSETNKVVDQVISRISGVPEMEEWYLMAGGSSTDSATLSINLVPREERERSTDEIARELQSRMEDIAGAEITVSASSSAMGSFSAGADVQFNILGDTTEQLMEASRGVTALLEESGTFQNVTSSLSDPVPEANIRINRVKAAPYGVTASSIASALNMAVSGSTATTYRVDGDEIDVRVMQPESDVQYLSDLQNITVTTAMGTVIPLTEVADVEVRDGASEITRSNQHRYITVSANTEGIDAGTAQEELTALLDSYEFPSGCTYEFTGNLDSMMESFQSLFVVLVVAILLVYMIMAAQFESFLYPFLIMFSLPLALTGGVLGLFVTGETITVVALMGFIMLVGMVVNNAIVLVDYTNQLRERGMGCEEALLEAGPTRLRPILMTTLTTVIGMIPMAVAVSEGTEMQKPMAIVIIFGMVISTLVTLIFVPVLYSSVERFRARRKRS